VRVEIVPSLWISTALLPVFDVDAMLMGWHIELGPKRLVVYLLDTALDDHCRFGLRQWRFMKTGRENPSLFKTCSPHKK
jgi:hypothetical protein